MEKNHVLKLPLQERIQYLYREASFIMGIRYYEYKINLYLLGNSYFEVFYNHKLDIIEKVQLLNTRHSRMKFYFDQIKIPKEIGV
ncbi:MAG: hypothetical protein OEW67_09680 [Cyclobacteriaceae bacterium]|nr:hypothetical protein [Cyclobacteriaceae bacterium]